MLVDGAGDLERGQYQAPRRVQHDVEGHLGIGEVDRPQDRLGIVHVDVSEDREAQDAHGLLAVHEEDHPGAALALDAGDQASARGLQEPLPEHRLKGGEHEEQPQEVAGRHQCLLH